MLNHQKYKHLCRFPKNVGTNTYKQLQLLHSKLNGCYLFCDVSFAPTVEQHNHTPKTSNKHSKCNMLLFEQTAKHHNNLLRISRCGAHTVGLGTESVLTLRYTPQPGCSGLLHLILRPCLSTARCDLSHRVSSCTLWPRMCSGYSTTCLSSTSSSIAWGMGGGGT